ncbi:MAG: BREX-1 system adenine-specific DNA-methyltransferase PglX [Holophagaceae bacterium]|nr:BREX-1 system adenine-specific DNA-methyltransferase PglX [Holophagaceae bacterium]
MTTESYQLKIFSEDPFINTGLFSDHYLLERITSTPAFQYWDEEKCREIHQKLKALYISYSKARIEKNEEDTRSEWISKVAEMLGFTFKRETTVKSGTPDYALFYDEQTRIDAVTAYNQKDMGAFYTRAITIMEAKYWNCPLKKSALEETGQNPVLQINTYLDKAHVLSNNQIKWAILTNGKQWRLYCQYSANRSYYYLEIDLEDLIAYTGTKEDPYARFRYFLMLFSAKAFHRQPDNKCQLDIIKEESHKYAIEIGNSLESVIYGREGVFVQLANGLWRGTGQTSKAIADTPIKTIETLEANTIVLLFRLLFLFYAEDKGLLPVNQQYYREVSLTELRRELQETHTAPKGRVPHKWNYLNTLFELINSGDPVLELPYYNGGLFDPKNYPLLSQLKIYDSDLIPAINSLSLALGREGEYSMIDFKDLGVRQLGSLYEGLLDYKLVQTGESFEITHDSYARRNTASYYTHEDLVSFLVKNTLEPILEERKTKADAILAQWLKCKDKKQQELLSAEILDQLLEINVLDPSMGSGHFLVSALDFITEKIIAILASHQDELIQKKSSKEHPVMKLLRQQRTDIIGSLKDQGMSSDSCKRIQPELDDLNLLKRLLMKRCLFGVDINPLAVELAKLSLWLDSFTLGAPLSFLDHHLKCGNSLIGANIADYEDVTSSGIETNMMSTDELKFRPQSIIKELSNLMGLSDATKEQVEQSKQIYADVEQTLKTIRIMLDSVTSRGFSNKPQIVGTGKNRKTIDIVKTLLADNTAFENLLSRITSPETKVEPAIEHLDACIKNIIEDRTNHAFFHWELAFPTVLYPGVRNKKNMGFDAVITNPPWERIKLQENEYFEKVMPHIALMQSQAMRKKAIEMLPTDEPQIWDDYQRAGHLRQQFLDYCHAKDSPYPLLGGGDTNLYGLIVERALGLINKTGKAGFIVPSGICTDASSALFFRQMVSEKRLSFIYDFENKKYWFPDIHAQFKFSLIGLSGNDNDAQYIPTASFLQRIEEIDERTLHLKPTDFDLLNPNTKTCPVFRTNTDLEITRRIYEKVPILIKHTPLEYGQPKDNPWGVVYKTLFHMTNDSGLFKTKSQLEQIGAWPEKKDGLPTYNSPKGRYVPLLEGKMVNLWNPRYASIRINLDNIHNKSSANATLGESLTDPRFFTAPQYYILEDELMQKHPKRQPWLFVFRDITNVTNFRTIVSAPVPYSALGNTLPFFVFPETIGHNLRLCFLADHSSIVKDFVARQKVQTSHLSLYIIEQLPALPPDFYSQTIHGHSWESLIAPRAFELSYTCDALKPMATAYGYKGKPYKWDEKRRLTLQAQLDALFFLAYGFDSKEDENTIQYILDTFPIWNRERPQYASLVMNYLRAYRAGTFDADITCI